jgi:sulfite reductase subunit B
MTPSESIYEPELATIESVKDLSSTEKLFRISLQSGKPLGHKPGQFVEVSIFGVGEAPISLSSSPTDGKGTFELGIRKVGNVTNAIHNLKKGSTIGIRGPFGTNFPIEETKGQDLLFVAGGIGLIPSRSFINYVLANRSDYGRVIILFGAKTPAERIFTDELEKWRSNDSIEYHETVDHGDNKWKGNVGVITTLFSKLKIEPKKTTAMIVGPPIMYRFVIIECEKKGILSNNITVSLERRMKCGVGKCGHCQIDNVYVCQDGPVFKYSDIREQGLKEAI